MLLAGAALVAACSSNPRVDVGVVPPGVSVDARVSYYEVSPASAGEIRRSFASLGPVIGGRRWAGATDWTLEWRPTLDGRDIGGCSVKQVNIHVAALITVPRWAPDESVAQETVEWWSTFSAGLMVHERGHVLLTVQAARELRRDLQGMTGPSCPALAQSINAAGQARLSRLRQQQELYDRTTIHGATQIDSVRAAGPRLVSPMESAR